MLQAALLLSAGCVASEGQEVGTETAFLGWVDLLVTSYWQGRCCVRAVPAFKFAFLDNVFSSQILISPMFHVVAYDKNVSVFFFSIKELLSSSNQIFPFLNTR